MKKPDFEEFLASIPPEQMEYLANGMSEEIGNSPANTGNLIACSCAAAFKGSLAMLGLYHQWLFDCLDEDR